jgi:GntR family transcriptional regulator
MDGATDGRVRSGPDWLAGQIDRSSPVPFYYQLQEILKRELEGDRWEPGDLLPSEAEFAAALGISRTVIRKALDVLEGDGLVYRVKGKGTVVAPPKFRYEAIATARDWYQHGTAATARLAKVLHAALIPATGQLPKLLQVARGEGVWELVALSEVSSEPVSLSQMYVRRDASAQLQHAGPSTQVVAEGGPEVLEQLAERWGVEVFENKLDIEHTVANEFEAQEMRITEGAPLLLLSLLSLDDTQRPVAFARTVVRSDRFHLSLSIPSRIAIHRHVLA